MKSEASGFLSSRRTTLTSIADSDSSPFSPRRDSLQPVSSFSTTPSPKADAAADGVKFVDESKAASGKRKRATRATPIRLVSGMQGTVLPEHHGALPKMGHTAVCYQQGVYVFGGVNTKGQYSNHVFCHEKRNLSWHEIRGVGVVPRGRANHAAVLIESKIYVFGGHRQLEVFDDLFAYDIVTSRWEKISYEQTQGPGGVFLHCMVHVPSSDSLFVVGGVHHREQNSYLGHLFDIRNRVWSGVPPPPAVDPQHLQLVAGAYHEPSNCVVVLGLEERDVMKSDYVAVPYVYLFQPQSFAWRRVETPTAPESPLPFRIGTLWERFLHLLITSGGGFYDSVLQEWMFPFPLSSSPKPAAAAAPGTQKKTAPPLPALPPPPTNKLGFLVLNLREMSWSLVLCKFPRKLLAEVKMYNAAERRKEERNTSRGNGGVNPLSPQANRSSSFTRANRSESGVLNISGLARAMAPNNSVAGVFGQRLPRRNLSSSSSQGVTWGEDADVSLVSGGTAGAGRRSGDADALYPGGDRYRRIINFQDVPEFTRKFVLVAVRDAPLRNGKLRPIQYIVLHGGLVEQRDYSMLAFKPKLTRVDALAATKQNGQITGLVQKSSYRALRGTRNSITSGPIDGEEMNDECNSNAFTPTTDAEFFSELFQDSTGGAGGGAAGAQKRFGDAGRPSYVSMEDAEIDAFSQTFRNSASDEELGQNLGNLEDGGAQLQRTSLLPTLPSARTQRNAHRFALQYTAENAVHTESLLPYANIPVAVLQSSHDVYKWSKNYYSYQRRWLSEKLRDALSEDRKLRRLRRAANARSGRPTSAGGSSAARASRNSMQSDVSLDDSDSLMESLYMCESVTTLARGGKSTKKKRSTIQAFEDQLAMEAAAAAVENQEAPKRRVQDFFEERHLEPFVAEDVAQLTRLSYDASTMPDERVKTKKLKRKQSMSTDASRSKKSKAASDVGAAGSKRRGSKAGAPSAASHAPAAVAAARPPNALAPIVCQSIASRVSFERFSMVPKRRSGRERCSSVGCPVVSDGGHNEVARNVSQLLMHNALDRFRTDDDSVETRSRKARLRWRFLRALVCTGEASYVMYLASQAQFKMKGITVSSTPGLVLAPELHLVGPSQAYRVPSKPVPYKVSNSSGTAQAPPPTSASAARFTQVTNSGMVVYHSLC
ncbi:hypothetical protein ABB37_05072 [Leptomonas pyrrhocoris]|uniref:Uncharacterized protein n=1 Tax=Leptomonas pyrrhocoris TaxID=157538 RepID=A0A0M9G149_LEPPY|nr:hypothetical protein ABB37_05072 [Leptomonas pyrrhocoris]KPA80057.1 hypothetical protein ABB37_05072 [Leptomonas pyrrhocoris]|eukprot:XP_015658496.1 hypothetical protein ABB37_05072 [Leptomonas pyrrhocoris]